VVAYRNIGIAIWGGVALIITIVVCATFIYQITKIGDYAEYPKTIIGFYLLISSIAGLVVHEVYGAVQYRYFELLFSEMMSMYNPPIFSHDMHRALTETERDDVIERLVGLSDKNWDRFLEFVRERHYFRFEEFNQNIIRDIEMVRALKD
jgi:hypothetical protein